MRLTKLQRALLATTAAAALTITGCGDDGGPDNPLAPNGIETATAPTIGTDPAAGAAMAEGAGTAPPANFGSEPNDADVGDANGSGLEIHGELPPGITRADLEARLADLQETFESEGTTQGRVVHSSHGATRPGMHTITGYSVNKDGDRYRVVLTLQPPNPRGNTDSNLVTERLRADGRFARVGTASLGASTANWAATVVTHNGTTHYFEPGWYVFWLSAQNCVNNHCALSRPSVRVVEIEEEEPEEEELPPDPPSLVSWSTGSWMCLNTECLANDGRVTLRNVVWSGFDVQIQGRLSFRDAPGAAFDETINVPTQSQGEIGFTFPISLRQGRYLVALRQRRIPDGPWSNWKAPTGRMQVEPTASERQAHGDLPGAPRRVILNNVGTDRWKISWDPPSNPGGWQVRDYRIGDTGTTSGYSRRCKGSGWPFRTARHHSTGAGENGRQFGYTVPVRLPEGWTISVSAVNARGEGDCTAAPVPD